MSGATNRTRDIAQDILNNLKGIQGVDENYDIAKDAKDKADTAAKSQRESIMSTMARLSREQAWTAPEIKAACKLVEGGGEAAGSNAPAIEVANKAMRTFLSDVKRAISPLVRDSFETILAARNAAWDAEEAAVAAAKQIEGSGKPATPCKKLWGRRYHALNNMTKITEERVYTFATADDVVRWAVDNDPDLDADKVEARLKKIIAQLEDLAVRFPVDELTEAATYLDRVTGDMLIASRGVLVSGETNTLGPKPAHIEDKVSPETNAAIEPMDAAYAIDDVLGDNVKLAA